MSRQRRDHKMSDRLIVALDVERCSQAERLVRRLRPQIRTFKVGSQLFTAAGPDVIRVLRRQRCRIFLDLKYHDIPSTVERAVRAAVRLRVWMVNIHLSGGVAMATAARKAVRSEARRMGIVPPHLIGVTVLTSVGTSSPSVVRRQVSTLSSIAVTTGLDGVVASPQEVALLRRRHGTELLVVTPGVRPSGAARGDQSRTLTPGEAVREGADYLVVGRPITRSRRPDQVVARVLADMESGVGG